MKIQCSPIFYNNEMESKYLKLYLTSRTLNKPKAKTKSDYQNQLVKFEVNYYQVSKANKQLNEASKNFKYLTYIEPTWLKQKVDKNAEKLGIKPYEQLNKKEDDFIMI